MGKPRAKLGSAWMSERDVIELQSKARSNRQAHERLVGSLNEKIERRRDEVGRSLTNVSASKRTPIINEAVSGYRNELKRESADARLAYVREAARMADQAKSVQNHYRSPVQVLARTELGSERRSRIMQQIASSGPAELASLAELAAAKADLELGAALCARAGDLPRDKRPFSTAELADALVGRKFRTVAQALAEIERLALEALHDDTTFETGRARPQRALELAMMRRDEANADPNDDNEDEDEDETEEEEI